MKTTPTTWTKAAAILGADFPEEGKSYDWYLSTHADGRETLEAWGYDEPFATNHGTSWTSPGYPVVTE